MVVGPRGIGSIIGSPLIGIVGSRVDNRKLLCGGFLLFGICAGTFSLVNLDIGPYTLLLPIMMSGFALSFIFVPLTTMTMSTLGNREIGNATGVYSMLRNIGGSIGISMATTTLIRRAAMHQTDLGAHITSSTGIFQQRAATMGGYMGHHIGPAQGRPGALGLLYGMMEQQAALMAYVDVFRWTALLAFFCAAATWLFKKPRKLASLPPGPH
jgi:DHA2 family multidrug resistance protein